eukprot:TRINITY_DN5330_c0_g1_i1.p1 TRINITY_DN5330_c0_g1~~TRINITY_DN5330_c0_g1_i1.p1  ORF type:complete len:511 (-),score=201.43 TRINITY_DN5330_c0_g1_i1:74-1606(-)
MLRNINNFTKFSNLKQFRPSITNFKNQYTNGTIPLLHPANICKKILDTQYAVRGEMVIRAEKLKQILKTDPSKLPFSEVVFCNIGNPQELEQKPITFFRQVISLVEYPNLIEQPLTQQLFPPDAIETAKLLLHNISSTGAYSNSQGVPVIRQAIADFITKRDNFPASDDDIFITDGASPGVQKMLKLLIRNENDGIMIPIPQYPLYSASITLFGGSQINYFLDEDNNWGLNINELERSWNESVAKGITPRGLVVINPGNPTGQCLDLENQIEIVKFCKRKNVVLLADEVYQENVYAKNKTFHSFKKVLRSLGSEYDNLELVSFHSVSKGFIGECGKRGGYFELVNIDPLAKALVYKLASISLCSNVIGQIMVYLMVNPPKPGQFSYKLYESERNNIIGSLKRRAELLANALNGLEGVKCNPAEGAMYLFPQVILPKKAVEEATRLNVKPDLFYTAELLSNTGICTVPGSGFGQRDGTHHFRITMLPPENKMHSVVQLLVKFHKEFMQKYK